MKFSFWT